MDNINTNSDKIDWNHIAWKSDENIKSYIRKFGNQNTDLSSMDHEQLLHLAKCTEKACAITYEENSQCSQCSEIIDKCHCNRCDDCYCVQNECKCEKGYKYSPPNNKYNDDEEYENKCNDDQQYENKCEDKYNKSDKPFINDTHKNMTLPLKKIVLTKKMYMISKKEVNDVKEDIQEPIKQKVKQNISKCTAKNIPSHRPFINENIENLAYKIKLKLFILDKTNKYKNKALNQDILRLIELVVMHHDVNIDAMDRSSIVKLFSKIETLDKQLQLNILKNIMYCLN